MATGPFGYINIRRSMRRHVEWRVRGWDTPRKLRFARAVVVFMCLILGLAGVVDVGVRGDAVREIDSRTEPLSADAVEVYRSLADADASLASEFLPGNRTRAAARARYDEDITRAAGSLARAGRQAGDEGLTAERISDIAAQLPVYTGLAEQARANGSRGAAGGVDSLLRASELMQSTILRRAEALQRDESERLDDQYRRVRPFPIPVLTLCVVTLATLAVVQLLLLRKTKRVLNLGLLTATATLVGLLLWWMVSFSMAGHHLETSRRHTQSVTDALGPAHIAALQARASEVLALVAPDGASYEDEFSARLQRLARNDGAGGAMGAAGQLVPDADGRALVEAAVGETRAWLKAHDTLRGAGRSAGAVAPAVDSERAGSAAAFNQLDAILASAVAEERTAFNRDIDRSHDARTGLLVGTGLLAFASAAAAALGIGHRLEEYR